MDYAQIVRWMSFVNMEVLTPLGQWFRPLIGRDPYNKKQVEDSKNTTLESIAVLETHFTVSTYFVGERMTLADLFAVSLLSRGFQFVFDKEFREKFPAITRWF